MKIAIVGNQGFSLFNFRGALIEDLVARGHSVYALAPHIDSNVAEKLRKTGAIPHEIHLARTGTNPFADLRTLFELWQKFRHLKPDIVLGYTAKPTIYGTLAAWLAGVPARFAMIEGLGYIFITRPDDGMSRRLLRKLVMSLFRLSLRKTEKVFFLNQDDIDDFTAMNLISQNQPVNIGGIGVDLAEWLPAKPILKPVTFIFVGRLLRDKGVIEFISAARTVKQTCPESRFLLVGGLDDNPESITRADVSGWVEEGLIEWPGHVPVAEWMEKASVFVLPSYREGVPRSTQEAMAMARPVITTDTTGCRDTVVDGVNGYLVPVRNARALADAMQKFIENPDLISAMGAQSRKLAEEKYDVRKVNAKIIATMGL